MENGFKKIEVTRQAFIVFVAVIISFFAQLAFILFFIDDIEFIQYIIFIIYMLIMIPLMVYGTNCLTTGKCIVLSWVVAFFYVFIAFINVFSLLAFSMVKSKKKGLSSSSKKTSR